MMRLRRRKKTLVIEPYVHAVIELEEEYVRVADKTEQRWRVVEHRNIWGYLMQPLPDGKRRLAHTREIWVRPEKLSDRRLWKRAPRCT